MVEIPELNFKIEIAELEDIHIGSYLTVEAILHELAYFLESICKNQEASVDKDSCTSMLEMIRQTIKDTPRSLTIRITNDYGSIKIIKTYRSNYRKC